MHWSNAEKVVLVNLAMEVCSAIADPHRVARSLLVLRYFALAIGTLKDLMLAYNMYEQGANF